MGTADPHSLPGPAIRHETMRFDTTDRCHHLGCLDFHAPPPPPPYCAVPASACRCWHSRNNALIGPLVCPPSSISASPRRMTAWPATRTGHRSKGRHIRCEHLSILVMPAACLADWCHFRYRPSWARPRPLRPQNRPPSRPGVCSSEAWLVSGQHVPVSICPHPIVLSAYPISQGVSGWSTRPLFPRPISLHWRSSASRPQPSPGSSGSLTVESNLGNWGWASAGEQHESPRPCRSEIHQVCLRRHGGVRVTASRCELITLLFISGKPPKAKAPAVLVRSSQSASRAALPLAAVVALCGRIAFCAQVSP